jgi:hypothetical protein
MRCRGKLLIISVLALSAENAWAVDLQERCAEDQIASAAQANGRNQWALACRLITKVDYDCATNNGYYWTFNSTTGGPNRAPVRPGASCDGFRKFTMCPAGCFEATQRVSFAGTYMTPESAFDAGHATVTALAADASLGHLSFTEEAIDVFVKGPELADLVRIELVGGQAIVVTRNHPMIDATGGLLPANEVKEGMVLMTVQGPGRVSRTARVPYAGIVWNVRPVKAEPKANINMAEGFLTGSIRYQNEWASDAARLLLRQSLDAELLDSAAVSK